MSYQDERVYAIEQQINQLNNVKRSLREREKSLNARAMYLNNPQTFAANNVKGLRNSLLGNLPNHMMPGNVGGINEVTWPFYFQANLDFGTDPSFADNVSVRSFFQVDQEAALILTSISRAHSTDAAGASATINAPIEVEFIDRQSSRRFNDAAMPLQMIGFNSQPSILPTGLLLMPNAFLDIRATGIPSSAFPVDFTGSGAFQISFFGYRVRTEDAGKVLSTIFSSTVA